MRNRPSSSDWRSPLRRNWPSIFDSTIALEEELAEYFRFHDRPSGGIGQVVPIAQSPLRRNWPSCSDCVNTTYIWLLEGALWGIHSLVSPACESGCGTKSRLTEVAVNVSGRLQIERARFGDCYETFCGGKHRFLPVFDVRLCRMCACCIWKQSVWHDLLVFNYQFQSFFLHFLNN